LLRSSGFAGMCIPSRCLGMNYSGSRASCHNINMTPCAYQRFGGNTYTYFHLHDAAEGCSKIILNTDLTWQTKRYQNSDGHSFFFTEEMGRSTLINIKCSHRNSNLVPRSYEKKSGMAGRDPLM
jgi:hypothetical protein